MLLAQLSADFQSLPLVPTSKLCPSGVDFWVGGLVYVLGTTMDPSSGVSCETGSFSHCYNCPPPRFLQPEVLKLSFPILEPRVAQSVSLSSCSSRLICTQMWDSPVCQPPTCPPWSISCHLAHLFLQPPPPLVCQMPHLP